ncbi:hypothetical protein HGRIS_007892 [Hohenbuehelia grisea]|uniref:Ras GEF n=1 Tax=Hohenbuehelia grisea TaxID=104357 RepID=A0ABR3J7M2_9AGAR
MASPPLDAQDIGPSLFSTAPSTPEPDAHAPQPSTSREAFPPGHYIVHTTASPPTSSCLAPQTLRKSVSVDSFVQYARDESSSAAGTRQSRVNTGSALDPPRNLVFGISDGLRRERERARSERSRAASVSTTLSGDDYEESVGGDAEPSDLLHSSPTGFRPQPPIKAHEQPEIFATSVQLPLPSRTPTLSTTSSTSSTSVTTTSSTQEDVPRLRATTSMQSMPRRGTVPTIPTSGAGRTRSGSLGVYNSPAVSGVRMVINTQLSSCDEALTIAVVGTPGCGKSVAIRKGLKSCSLGEPLTFSAPSGTRSWSRYSQRIGRTSNHKSVPDAHLYVIEIDISASPIDPPALHAVAWPDGTPRVDGVIICYDVSDEASFAPVISLLRGYRDMKLPVIVLACKDDLQPQVDSTSAAVITFQLDTGLIEVTSTTEAGKSRIRRTFEWLLKSIFRARSPSGVDDGRNPASPDFLPRPSWETPRTGTPTVTTTPTASSSMSSMRTVAQAQAIPRHSPTTSLRKPSSRTSDVSSSPVLARASHDIPPAEPRASQERRTESSRETNYKGLSTDSFDHVGSDVINGSDDHPEEPKEEKESQSRPAQWASLDDLLDKLIFLAVSGDDPAFITHFLLTYRRFATPRSVILAMQKRMRQLDNPSGDPMFACFAQMRICSLLDQWIREYPHDFAVPNTAGALNALTKSIVSKTYLLHYGSEFLPFTEMLASLHDRDNTWALKPEDTGVDSEGSSDEEEAASEIESTTTKPPTPIPALQTSPSQHGVPRARKPSLPLAGLGSRNGPSSPPDSSHSPPTKQLLAQLVKVAQTINATDSEEIARQITLAQAQSFLAIEPRHWLHFTFTPSNKDPNVDTIGAYNAQAERLGQWVVSLILCHDRPSKRARQIEKFVDIAQKLRAHNNYSALRAFVAGINNSTFPGDDSHERFKTNAPEQAKNLSSWDVLLRTHASHRAYRLALRNSRGAVIPALEVHMNDLIRAHEGNKDSDSNDPTKIHWGKYHLVGRLVGTPTACQAQCRASHEYHFEEKPSIKKLVFETPVMDEEFQKSRIAPPDFDVDDNFRPAPSEAPKDVALLRKLFFW